MPDFRTMRVCEPDQTKLVLRVAMGGAIAAIVMMVAGSALGPPILQGALTFVALYAASVLIMFGRLVWMVNRSVAVLSRQGQPIVSRPTLIESVASLYSDFMSTLQAHKKAVSAAFSALTLGVVIIVGLIILLPFSGKNDSATDRANSKAPPQVSLERTTVDIEASKHVVVPATAGPTSVGGSGLFDTGIFLKPDAPVRLFASGEISCVPSDSWCTVGPDGDPTTYTGSSTGFPLAGAPAWGLIAQIGDGPLQFIGANSSVSGNGLLKLGVNDNVQADDVGSFEVVITFKCSEPPCPSS